MKIIKLVFLGFFLLSLKSYLLSQSKEFVFVTPGSEYQASWFEEFFLGEQWRALWTIGITVEQLKVTYLSGGFNFSLIDRQLNFSDTYAVSPEASALFAGSQLGFKNS